MHHNCTYQTQNELKLETKKIWEKLNYDNQCIQNEYSEFVLTPN